MTRPYRLKLCCFTLLLVVGCGSSGPELAAVTGTITANGAPLPGANVQFVPENGRPSLGLTDAQGRYELYFTSDVVGALIGNHTVRITAARGDGDGTSPGGGNSRLRIPAKYNSKSELKSVVVNGANVFDFNVDVDPIVPTGKK